MDIPKLLLKQLIQLYENASYDKAERLAKTIIKQFPNNQFAWKVLGAVLVKKGRVLEAELPNQKSVELSPNDAQAHYNLGINYKKLGKYDDAVKSYKEAIVLKPDYAEAYNNLGSALKELAMPEDAKINYSKAITLRPNYAEANYNLGIIFYDLGKFEEAVESYKKAIVLKPDYAEAYNNLGTTQQEFGRVEEAEELYRKALKINPFLEDAYLNLCELMEKLNRLEDGLRIANNAKSKMTKKFNDLLLYKSLILYRQKEIELSYECFGKIKIDILSKKRKVIYYNLYGNLLNNQKKFKDAFTAFKSMNYEIKKLDHYKKLKADEYFYEVRKGVEELKNLSFKTKEKKLINQKSIQPAFLIGFPRSGTTLLDTILRSHSKIDVIEEKPMIEKIIKFLNGDINISSIEKIDFKITEKLKAVYFEELKKHKEKDESSILVDKLPLNILHLPLINKIFPHAKFILVLRHPFDCILSCWMQNFKLNRAMANMCDLDRIVDFYCTTMESFYTSKKIYKLQVHQVRYEDLINGFESQVLNILNFLNLKWENSIKNYQKTASERPFIDTPSYSQVVKPIYDSSTYRWKNYEIFLKPYKVKLNSWFNKFGYSN